jgi:hypothetical protein
MGADSGRPSADIFSEHRQRLAKLRTGVRVKRLLLGTRRQGAPLPHPTLRFYVDVVIPLAVELVPPLDMLGQLPGLLEDVDWPVPLEDVVLDVDVELVCADANVRDERAATTAIAITAMTKTLLLSVLILRLIFVFTSTNTPEPAVVISQFP